MARALEDVRVLDFTRVFSGPFCTLQLAELGAEVIKVEMPGGGDSTRSDHPRTDGGESGINIDLNRGKKSITLNLATDKGRGICMELAKNVDVVVENFSPRVMRRLGLDYDALSKVNPQLIYASLSGFGHTGPYSPRPAYDPIAQAMGGFMSVTGLSDGPPILAGIALGDYIPGLYTAIAILAAVHHRTRTGQGQCIDMSMHDCMFATTAVENLPRCFLTGQSPARQGNRGQVYRTRDGHVVISIGNIGQWDNLLRVIQREDLIGVEKYGSYHQRMAHAHEVQSLIETWTGVRDVDQVVTELSNAHLPCSPILSYEQILGDPQLASRGMVVEVEQVISGRVKAPGSPYKLSATPGNPTLPAPFLGENNQEVYCGLLGYSEQALAQLADEGVL